MDRTQRGYVNVIRLKRRFDCLDLRTVLDAFEYMGEVEELEEEENNEYFEKMAREAGGD